MWGGGGGGGAGLNLAYVLEGAKLIIGETWGGGGGGTFGRAGEGLVMMSYAWGGVTEILGEVFAPCAPWIKPWEGHSERVPYKLL